MCAKQHSLPSVSFIAAIFSTHGVWCPHGVPHEHESPPFTDDGDVVVDAVLDTRKFDDSESDQRSPSDKQAWARKPVIRQRKVARLIENMHLYEIHRAEQSARSEGGKRDRMKE